MLLSFAASAEDPISGGRHKVIGSKPLFIPPQTSTIASHLPKAVGAAFSIGIARMLKLEDTPLPPRFDRARQLRRRLGQPFDRAGRVQHRRLGRLSGHADAARLPVRGQWHRHLDADPARLDRGARSRTGRRSNMSIAAASTWSTPIAARARPPAIARTRAQARLPAHGLRAALRPCRLRRAGHLSHQGADRGGRGARSPALQRRPAGRAGPAFGRRDPRHLQRDRGDARPDRRAGDRPAQAHHQRGGDGEHRPAEARARAAPTRRRPEQREALFARDRGDDGQAAAHGAAAELGAGRSDARAPATSSSPARMSGPRAASTTSPPSCTSASARRG